jgi:hypothetical protein
MALPKGITLKIPTDLLGVNPIKYDPTDIADGAKELLSVIRSLGSK